MSSMIFLQWFSPRRTLLRKPLLTRSVTSLLQRLLNLDDCSVALKRAKVRPMQLGSMSDAAIETESSHPNGSLATGGSSTAEMSMRYSTFTHWLSRIWQATRWLSWYSVGLASADRLPVVVRIPAGPLGSLKCDPPKGNGRRPQKNWLSRIWLACMDESQEYGNYHEIAALAEIQQPALIVFVGDHRQTPGGLCKGRAAAANRQKLLQRLLGLRPLNRPDAWWPCCGLMRVRTTTRILPACFD